MHWHSKGLELGNKQYNSVKVFILSDLLESPLAIYWKERSRNTHKDPFTVTFVTVIFIAMRNLGGGWGGPLVPRFMGMVNQMLTQPHDDMLCSWDTRKHLWLSSRIGKNPFLSTVVLSCESPLLLRICHFWHFQSPNAYGFFTTSSNFLQWQLGIIQSNLPGDNQTPRRRQWHPTAVLLSGKSHGWRSLVGCSPWGHWVPDTTEQLHFYFSLLCTGGRNGNPL